MFLKALSDYAEQIADRLPPPMYQYTPIRYTIHLNRDGGLRNVYDHQDERHKRGIEHPAPYCKRSSGIRAKVLVDTVEYTLGIVREGHDDEKARKKQQAYRELLKECVQDTQIMDIEVIIHFLETTSAIEHVRLKLLDPTENVTFRIEEDTYLFLDPRIQAFWASKASAGSDEALMQCLVCGNMRPPVERLPIVIKGIPGGQATGMTLISANSPAFESYGLTASLIAPTCEICGEKFGNALNDLLRNEHTHTVVASLAYVFWVKDPKASLDIPKLLQAEPAHVKQLIEAPHSGQAYRTFISKHHAFYAVTLSASGARIVIRDWMETTVEYVLQNMRRYFSLQSLQSATTGELEYFPLWKLVHATINLDTQEKPLARTGQELFRVALHGGALPRFLLHAVLQRVRARRQIQPAQAALIKLMLLSQPDHAGFPSIDERSDVMTMLEESFHHDAYVCGRLFALLDYIQYRALGRVNATISDRFYGTASSAPAVVFPRLLRSAQPHLTAIRQSRNVSPHRYLDYLEEDLSQLMDELPKFPHGFPRALSLIDQGWFALGFHHQRVKLVAPRPATPLVSDESKTAEIFSGQDEPVWDENVSDQDERFLDENNGNI